MDLNKAAIVFEADIAAHADGRSAFDHLANHGPVGHPTHHAVGEQLPPDSDRGQGRIAAQIVDDG